VNSHTALYIVKSFTLSKIAVRRYQTKCHLHRTKFSDYKSQDWCSSKW